MLTRLRRNWERKKSPPDFIHLLGTPLSGYKFIKVWQAAGMSALRVDVPINKCREVEEASKFVEYLARDRSLPYILSADKEWLIEILLMAYPEHIYKAWETLIRPCLVMSTKGEGWAIPASGFDNRKTFVDGDKIDLSVLPNWSWLLHGEDYTRLTSGDELCFVSALSQTRTIRYIPTP